MTFKDLLKHYGTQQAAADALRLHKATISAWKTRGRIPLGRQYEIQVLTGGALRADSRAA